MQLRETRGSNNQLETNGAARRETIAAQKMRLQNENARDCEQQGRHAEAQGRGATAKVMWTEQEARAHEREWRRRDESERRRRAMNLRVAIARETVEERAAKNGAAGQRANRRRAHTAHCAPAVMLIRSTARICASSDLDTSPDKLKSVMARSMRASISSGETRPELTRRA